MGSSTMLHASSESKGSHANQVWICQCSTTRPPRTQDAHNATPKSATQSKIQVAAKSALVSGQHPIRIHSSKARNVHHAKINPNAKTANADAALLCLYPIKAYDAAITVPNIQKPQTNKYNQITKTQRSHNCNVSTRANIWSRRPCALYNTMSSIKLILKTPEKGTEVFFIDTKKFLNAELFSAAIEQAQHNAPDGSIWRADLDHRENAALDDQLATEAYCIADDSCTKQTENVEGVLTVYLAAVW